MTKTVTTYLNIRLDSPDTAATCLTYLSPGDTIEVAEVVKGIKLEDNDVWLRLIDNTFVWSGGTNEDAAAHFPVAHPASANNDLSKSIVLNNPIGKNGSGVVIGICDSGVDIEHTSLKASLILEEDFLVEIPHAAQLMNDHGSRVAGLLSGNDNRISGLAIDARLRSFKVLGDQNETDENGLSMALETILKDASRIDVVNLSLSFSDASTGIIQSIIDKMVAKGIIVTVAGNEGGINNINEIAKLQRVISVGTFNANEFDAVKQNWFPATIHFAYLNAPIISMGLKHTGDGHAPISHSSAYTAVTAGIIARFLSQQFISIGNRQQAVMDYLRSCSFDISNENQPIPLKLYSHA